VNKKTKKRVQGVAVFVVFLALATTIFVFNKKENRSGAPDFKASTQKFQSMKMINKAQVQFSSENLKDAKAYIESIVDNKAIKSIEQVDQPAFGSYLFIIPKGSLHQVVEEMGTKGKVLSRTTMTDTSLVNLDLDVEQGRLLSYEKEMRDLDQVRFPSEMQIRRKESLHGLIAESRTKLDRLQDAENLLLYITAVTLEKRNSFAVIIRDFSFSFLMWLGLYFVGVVLVYYGTKLLMLLLNMMGIKGLGISGTDYAASYNYGGFKNYSDRYGYGYGQKRKTKRIYKEKPKPTEEEEK